MQKHCSLWDQADAFQLRAEAESSDSVLAGALVEFERQWQDPRLKLLDEPWFTTATPPTQKVIVNSLRGEIAKMIEYYRFAEKELVAISADGNI
jgi:hypothetical protein